MPEKILVTGGAGFIGSAVIRHLIRHSDTEIVNADKLTYAANPAALETASASGRYHFEKVDICDGPAIRALFARHRPTKVIHLAAESHVDRSIDGPRTFIDTNICGTFSLLEAARDYHRGLGADESANFRFHHVSTDEVFGTLHMEEPAFSESSPYKPNSPYSASKAASDHLVRAWSETFHLPVVISNCSNNYGPWQFPEKLIPVVIANGLRRKPIPVYGQGLNVRDWLHVEDHAEAIVRVCMHGRLGESYNIGGNAESRNIDLIHAICAELDAHHPGSPPHADLITFVTDRPGHDLRYAINADKIRTDLGWTPRHTLASGLKKTVAWYLAHRQWLMESRATVADRLGLDAAGRTP